MIICLFIFHFHFDLPAVTHFYADITGNDSGQFGSTACLLRDWLIFEQNRNAGRFCAQSPVASPSKRSSIWQLAINVTIWLTPTALPWDLRLLGSMRQEKTRQTMFFVHSKYVVGNFFSRRSNGLLPEHYPIWQIKCKPCIFFFKQANFHTTYNAINVCPIVICFILFNNMELTEKCGSTQTIAYSSWLSAIIFFFCRLFELFSLQVRYFYGLYDFCYMVFPGINSWRFKNIKITKRSEKHPFVLKSLRKSSH